VRGLDIFDVQQHFGNHVGNRRHFRFLHPARRDGGRAQPDAAGLERRAGLERNCVFVDRDAGLVQRRLAFLAGQVFAPTSTSIKWLSVPPLTRR
jgi:hypothetical protein